MSALNDIFMETYKEIDKHCRDMFVDEKGLGRYIEEMKNIPDIGKYYHKAKSALSRLSEYRRIRNSLVYDVGTSYSDMVEQSDITWLVSFKNSLQNCTDPLSAYRRNKENRASKNAKNTNVKELKLTSKSKLALAVGKNSKIKAKVVLVDSAKKQLSDSHTKEFRYASSNKKVAAVDKNGKITAKAKGTCYIYVYAKNGYAKKVTVTVK